MAQIAESLGGTSFVQLVPTKLSKGRVVDWVGLGLPTSPPNGGLFVSAKDML